MGNVIRSSVSLTILILVWVPSLMAQAPDIAWYSTYPGDWGESVEETSAGGYIVVGGSSRFGEPYGDVVLIRTDANGDTLWIRTYGGPGPDFGNSVQQTSDGGFVVAGWHRASYNTDYDVYLIRTGADGDTVWTRTFGGPADDFGNSVRQTSDGGFIVGASTDSYGSGGRDAYLIRVTADGDTLWTRVYGGTGNDYCDAVRETSDGNIVALGSTGSFGPGTSAVFLLKADANGDTLWTRTYGGTGGDRGRDIEETGDYGYIIIGETASVPPFGLYVVRTDGEGDTLWTRAYGADGGYAVQQTLDGGFVGVGTTWFACGMEEVCSNICVVKTSREGDVEWLGEYGGADSDIAYDIHQTLDGGFIMTGLTQSYGGGNILLMKLESDRAGTSQRTGLEGSDFRFRTVPNPSGTGVTMLYSVARPGYVCIAIYDLLGRKVRTVLDTDAHPGQHTVAWDGTDRNGDRVPAGVYFCRFRTASTCETQKIILLK